MDAALDAAGLLAVRLRQIGRRAPELMEIVELADRELARIVDQVSDADEIIGAMLLDRQIKRRELDNEEAK